MPAPVVMEPEMIRPPLLGLLALLTVSPALSQPFVLLIHETPDQIALRADTGAAGQAYWAAYADWGQQAADAGVMRGGAAMVPAPVVTLGHLAPAPLVLGGFFQIDVPDRATAEAWAARLPAAATGAVEIRSTVVAPGM
jgi:hypothetical protein